MRCDAPQAAIEQHIIMPPHIIIVGMPPFIMAIMRLQHSMNIAGSMPSIGFISQTMPASVILQDIVPIIIGMGIGIIMGMPPIIGIMPFIIIGDIIGWPMPPIMVFIIGIMFIAVFIKVSRPVFRVSMTGWVINAPNTLKEIILSKNLSSNGANAPSAANAKPFDITENPPLSERRESSGKAGAARDTPAGAWEATGCVGDLSSRRAENSVLFL